MAEALDDGRELRVAMVSARALPCMGGIETHVHEVATRLGARGVDVTVFTTDLTRSLPRDEVVGTYRTRRFDAHPRRADYYLSPSLVRAVAQCDADVVHVQGVHTLVAPGALLAAQRAGKPTVLTFHTGGHSSAVRDRIRSLQWRAVAPLARRAELVAVCEFEIDLFARAFGVERERFHLIRNGSEPLSVDPDASLDVHGAPLVLSVGRLERYKGHHRVIAALPALQRRSPAARLVVVGSGPYEAELRRCAEAHHVAHAVSFRSYGPDERGALGALVARADVVALLSEYEAHPVALMEALGVGTPVVAADTSGMSELGRSGLLTLVPLDAPGDDVAAALASAAQADRWGDGPPPLPTWDDCAARLLDLYRATVAQDGAPERRGRREVSS